MFETRYVTIYVNDMVFCRQICLILMLVTLVIKGVSAVNYSSLGVEYGLLGGMGLIEIPTSIPCDLLNLDLRENLITRIEAYSFACLDQVTDLDVGYNKISYIAMEAFDPLISLEVVRLRGNKYLPELPPHYGSNTANMRHLYIQHINLQIIPPDSYFDQMPMLQHLATSIDLRNDFFDGWENLNTLFYYGDLAPNFTERTPNIDKIEINKVMLTTKKLPDENAVGLTKLTTFKMVDCDSLPLLDGAVALQTLDVTSCQITSLPDYRHLASLQTFSPDTSQFHCDIQSCWMIFETITNAALASVIQNIVCHGPDKFRGLNLTQLSPVQLKCFEGSYGKHNSPLESITR